MDEQVRTYDEEEKYQASRVVLLLGAGFLLVIIVSFTITFLAMMLRPTAGGQLPIASNSSGACGEPKKCPDGTTVKREGTLCQFPTCPTEPGGVLYCTIDAQCVPASECHPKTCINGYYAKSTVTLMCDLMCMPNTLDCGQKHCECKSNKCVVVSNR